MVAGMDIVTRKDAKAQGLTRYFTGKPCPHGHISERMTSSGGCVACLKEKQSAYYKTEKGLAARARVRDCPNKRAKQREYMKSYYVENRDKWLEAWEKQKQCPETMAAKKARDAEFRKKYDADPKNIERRRIRIAKKVKDDPNFALSRALRRRLYMALRNNAKSGSAVSDLGCSIDFLRQYLEGQFEDGMSWGNHGEWHIDHIEPLASFDLTDANQIKEACHYTNLQPLWAEENLMKGAA